MSKENELQAKYGTVNKAANFEKTQKLNYLNETMIEFISKQELLFIATSDNKGNCDSSIRSGKQGFVKVKDPLTLFYPEYRGNGVFASLGNIAENPHIGLLFIDFFQTTVGLHINGKASILKSAPFNDPLAERWVSISVEEAYIHCSKHIPLLQKKEKNIHWGTNDAKHKGATFFSNI